MQGDDPVINGRYFHHRLKQRNLPGDTSWPTYQGCAAVLVICWRPGLLMQCGPEPIKCGLACQSHGLCLYRATIFLKCHQDQSNFLANCISSLLIWLCYMVWQGCVSGLRAYRCKDGGQLLFWGEYVCSSTEHQNQLCTVYLFIYFFNEEIQICFLKPCHSWFNLATWKYSSKYVYWLLILFQITNTI